MEEHPLVCYGDQQSLANALSKLDIESFRRALHSPTEVEKYEVETSMTIFEQACQTPGCAQFIEECILAGCDVNKLNAELNKRPINFVVESHCVDNLAALLRDPGVDVNSTCSMFKTPVNFLAEQISNDNFFRVYPCIKLLIQHGADVNMPNNRQVTPIINVLKNRHLNIANKEAIVRYLLQSVVEVDIDSHRNGEARALLKKLLPDIELSPEGSNHVQPNIHWDFNRFYLVLKNEREQEFIQGMAHTAEKSPDSLSSLFTASENRETLLVVAVAKNLPNAVEKMMELGADVNHFESITRDALPPAKCACIRGHWKCLELLMENPDLDVNSAPLLPIVVRNLSQEPTKSINFEKCFEMLLNHPHIDINQLDDVTHCTALHYAVKFNYPNAIMELLNRGAHIGVRNSFNQLSISNIKANLLEKHFDRCISTNGLRRSDDKFEIQFDYKNLVPIHITDGIADEMTSIEYISKSNDLRPLIRHPLIASFLSMKWNRLALFFYVNFILFALFAVITVTYILMFYSYDEPSALKTVLRIVIFLLTIYIAVREMSQFTFSPCVYLRSLENYMECTLVVIVILILFDVCTEDWRKTFAATSILLIAIEVFLLAGSLPFWSFSTHYVMLKTVTWTFLKSLSLYAIILLAFSLSFFTLLHEPDNGNAANSKRETSKDEGEDDGDFNKFSNLGLSLMKTLVMSTGEFDVASINFEKNAFSYFVFITFLFLVSIVLLNLLNGLAVSDTQAIKSEAELTNLIRRSQVLARYDGVLASSCPIFFKIFPFCSSVESFDEIKSISMIRIKPNDNNRILVPNDGIGMTQTEELRPMQCVHLCSDRCARMDSKIVKLALQALEKAENEQQEQSRDELLEKRISKMEATLDTISDKLDGLLRK